MSIFSRIIQSFLEGKGTLMQNVHNSHFVADWWTARQMVAFYPES